MRNLSSRWKEKVKNGMDVHYLKYADITLTDGTVLNLTNADLWQNGMTFEDSVSGDSSFDIGSAIINVLTLSINNFEGQYSDYDFEGAEAVCYIGLQFDDGIIEKTRICTATVVEQPEDETVSIDLTCEDNMRKFDRNYSESKLIYPATREQIVRDACEVCGVTLQTVHFDNDDYIVKARPSDDALTFRQVLQWVAQIGCQWMRCDEYGRLCVSWFDDITEEKLIINENGVLTTSSESNIVLKMSNQDETLTAENGILFENDGTLSLYAVDGKGNVSNVSSTYGFTPQHTDVVITGVLVTEYNDSVGEEPEKYMAGLKGYVLDISGNKLIQKGEGKKIASMIAEKCVGMSFRPFESECPTNISLEAGDVVIIVDRNRKVYKSFITTTTLQPGNGQKIACNAKSAAKNSSTRYSQLTQAYVEARKMIKAEKTAREKALEEFGKRMDAATGVYTTIEKQEDGSEVFYLHDKPTLAESKAVWKMTSEAWGVSTDGGKTWNGGMTVDGDTIVRILNAVGINADWINTGKLLGKFIDAKNLRVSTEDGTVTFYINEKGQVFIQPTAFFLSDNKTLDEAIADKTIEEAQKLTTLNVILSNEYQAIVTDANGNYTTFPECSTTVQVMYGVENVTNDASYTITEDNVTGTWDEKNHKYTVTGLSADTGHVNFVVNYKTFSITKQFSISKQKQGKQGDKGDSATTYVIETDTTVIMRTADETYVPETVLFKNYVVSGNNKILRKSNILVQTTTDGSTFSTIKNVDVDDGQYTLYLSTIASDVTAIRYIFRSINLGNPQLATVTIPIINDTELTEKQIFNLLTHNGTRDLLTYVDGKLYLNGTYIKGKTVAADKLNVEDLYAVAASIAQWTIKENYIQSKSGNIRLYSDGRIKIGNAVFSQSEDGDTACNIKYGLHLFCKNITDSSGFIDPSGMFAISGLASNASGSTLILYNNYVYKLSSSSKRYKKHVKNMTSSEAERLLDIPVVWFEYNEGYLASGDRFEGKPLPGFYAEDVYDAFPEGAMLNESGQVEDWNYRTMVPAMMKLIQDQQETINSLNKRIERLERGE